MFVISRIEQYKFSSCAAVYAESSRKLINYDNPNWDPSKAKDNVYLIEPLIQSGIEQHILNRKKEYKCRLSTDPSLPLNKQTNCFCQAIFTASPEFFQRLTEKQKEQYFEHCLSFFSSKFESVEIIDAVWHKDETTDHLHVNFLPFIAKRNSKGKLKTVFSSSELFQGKDFFTRYQDEFHDYIQERYPNIPFERKGDLHQDHLSVREYKEVRALVEEAKEELVEIEIIKEEAKHSVTPLIDAKIANADLKRENNKLKESNKKLQKTIDAYNWFIRFLLEKFPKLQPLVDAFFKQKTVGDNERSR